MKYGIFGGTFDPFTPAHYEMVVKCLNSGEVDKVIVLPTVVDYYRKDKTSLFSVEQRKFIIENWFADVDRVIDGTKDVILDFYEYNVILKCPEHEVKNRRYLHMLETVISTYGKYNEYFTIIGGDSLEKFQTWYMWQDILKLSKIIAFSRGSSIIDLIGNPISCTILTIDNKLSAMSASGIRDHLLSATEGMGMGPNGTPYEVYMSEIRDYLKTGKTYLDHEAERHDVLDAFEKMKQAAYDSSLKVKEDKLMKIANVLQDAYKDVECKYSLVEDIIAGKI